MVILSKKRFQFKNSEGGLFVTAGGMAIETAPDWIKKHPLYALAVKDGSIVETKAATPAKAANKKPEKTAANE